MTRLQKITPFLWFDNQAEEAANFYVSVFANSRVVKTVRRLGDVPGPSDVLTVAFELEGQQFTALNGGPHFHFTEAVSFVVHCDDQAEVDHFWTRLAHGDGSASQCGWLKDRFGLSWQVVPERMFELLSGPDAEKSARVMNALMTMTKLDLAALEAAYAG